MHAQLSPASEMSPARSARLFDPIQSSTRAACICARLKCAQEPSHVVVVVVVVDVVVVVVAAVVVVVVVGSNRRRLADGKCAAVAAAAGSLLPVLDGRNGAPGGDSPTAPDTSCSDWQQRSPAAAAGPLVASEVAGGHAAGRVAAVALAGWWQSWRPNCSSQ